MYREGERGNEKREKRKGRERKRDHEIEIERGTPQPKAYRANTYTVMMAVSRRKENQVRA